MTSGVEMHYQLCPNHLLGLSRLPTASHRSFSFPHYFLHCSRILPLLAEVSSSCTRPGVFPKQCSARSCQVQRECPDGEAQCLGAIVVKFSISQACLELTWTLTLRLNSGNCRSWWLEIKVGGGRKGIIFFVPVPQLKPPENPSPAGMWTGENFSGKNIVFIPQGWVLPEPTGKT